MPLDSILIKHLDEQDILESQIEDEIDVMMNKLTVQDMMNGAGEAMIMIATNIQKVLRDNYYHKAAAEGIKLAKAIEKDGDIKIQDSNDPQLNEGVLSDDKS